MGNLRKVKEWPISQSFLNYSRSVQVILIGMISAGVASLIIGLKTDLSSADWSQSLGFITNIWAGFTGFLIGVPVALVVLATITAQREEQATLQRVNRLSQYAWYTFRDLAIHFASSERFRAVQQQGRDVKDAYDEVSASVAQYLDHAHGNSIDFDNEHGLQLGDKVDYMIYAADKLRTAINSVVDVIGFNTENEWAQLVGAWRVLDEYVRLQRLEQGLEWFGDEPDAGLQRWMVGTSNPLQEFMDAVRIRTYTPTQSLAANNMWDALETLDSYIRMTDTARTEVLLQSGNIFTAERGRRYSVLRDAAHLFIIDLPRFIYLVEYANWPESQSKPRSKGATAYETTNQRWIGSLSTEEGRRAFEREFRRIAAEKSRDDGQQSDND